MIKHRSLLLTIGTHVILVLWLFIMLFPIYLALATSSHNEQSLLHAPIPLSFGHHFLQNYKLVLFHGLNALGGIPVWVMLKNSLIMALLIAFGKIIVSIFAAYAIVYFRFPLRMFFFWLIFMTLMLPVEVRIVPTFQVVAEFHLIDSYWGLSLPLIASATATFLFRQFFRTIPSELLEAARVDGAGPLRFFLDILLPLSRTNIAALFIIMFLYGWNQYLWPLLATTTGDMSTIVMGMQRLANIADQIPQWNYIMATAILALLPPVVIIIVLQKLFVRGLIDSEK
ncbi:MAG: sn-glycerol-3-phosphate ABC transporter permease UgpE [Pseudomonadota bacterium]